MDKPIQNISCLGVGTIGSGWAALFSLKGFRVVLYDAKDGAAEHGVSVVSENLDFLVKKKLIDAERKDAALRNIRIAHSFQEAVSDAQWIQESAFESYEVKRELLAQIDAYAPEDAIYATSSSGLLISRIAEGSAHPERCIAAHPYSPVHIVPLVELAGACEKARPVLDRAKEFLRSIGKEPIVLKKEVMGYVANRLQAAVQREMCQLLCDGVTDVESIDKSMVYGVALRWAILGPGLVLQLGGRDARTMVQTLVKSSDAWLKDMADFKEFPDEFGDVLQAGVDAELKNRSAGLGNDSASLCAYRDDMLLQFLSLHHKLSF